MDDADFTKLVWQYYRQAKRDLPWRRSGVTPYEVLLSEIMLQQTQVGRVIDRFEQFMAAYPTIADLAAAPLDGVLRMWLGLGYNRRAKFLWQTARMVIDEFDGKLPASVNELVTLPGIGTNTAGAIMAYAYNQPAVFIETNIRTVYLHHYFEGQADVSDAQIRQVVERTIDQTNPREWYWALMDYGTHLKATLPRHLHRAKGHSKQSTFEGSLRQVRGQVLRALAKQQLRAQDLAKHVTDNRLDVVVEQLAREGLIVQINGQYSLATN